MIRRFFQSILVVLMTLLLVFVLFKLEGAQSLARSIYPSERADPAQIQKVINEYGFNKSILDQLWIELRNYATGNFGRTQQNQTVLAAIGTALPRTIVLVGMSIFFALVVAIPLGVWQAVHRNGPIDYIATGVTFVLYAMPAFVFGFVLLLLFEQDLHIFTPIQQTETVWQIAFNWKQITLPMITLSATSVAAFSRYMRSSMLDALTEDYVRTAKAKGASVGRVLFRHGLRNALLPIITLVGLSLPAVAGGAVITEQVFNYPGMGQLTAQAAGSNEVQLVVGTTVVATILTVVGSLVADILYAVADPRIRYASK
jgi:peptide/nickel transport system permease protein